MKVLLNYNDRYVKVVLDHLSQRFEKEFEEIKKENSYLYKYVGENIVEAMKQYNQSTFLSMNMTKKHLQVARLYHKEHNMLKDIIIYITEFKNEEYKLGLDFGDCYNMVIDFIDDIDTLGEVKCLNCGHTFEVYTDNIYEDKLGTYVDCEMCNATFNID